MRIIIGRHKILFIGERYTTSYDKDKKTWSCDCIHGSLCCCKIEKFPCKHIKEAKKQLALIHT